VPLVEPCRDCPWSGGLGVVRSTERRAGVEVAFIGEGPAEDEVRAAARDEPGPHCFVGAAGRELEVGTLGRVGLARVEVAVENAHQCARPDKGGMKEIRAVRVCRERVEEFLRQVRPRGVMLLGGAALRSVLGPIVPAAGSARLLKHRGAVWSQREVAAMHAAVGERCPVPQEVDWIGVSIHPAAIIRRKRLEKFPAMAYRAVPGLDTMRLLQVVRRGRKFMPFVMHEGIEEARLRGGFVFDLETDGTGRIEWIGMQALDGGPVYGEAWWSAREKVRRLMRMPVVKVGHNIQGFDIPRLEEAGIDVVPPFEDTMAQGGLCEPDLARGLAFRSALRFGHERPYWKELSGAVKPDEVRRQTALRAAWAAMMPAPLIPITDGQWRAGYCALDVDSTRRLWAEQNEVCRREGWI